MHRAPCAATIAAAAAAVVGVVVVAVVVVVVVAVAVAVVVGRRKVVVVVVCGGGATARFKILKQVFCSAAELANTIQTVINHSPSLFRILKGGCRTHFFNRRRRHTTAGNRI